MQLSPDRVVWWKSSWLNYLSATATAAAVVAAAVAAAGGHGPGLLVVVVVGVLGRARGSLKSRGAQSQCSEIRG